jgi:Family of unknown function (DUF5675)
MDLTLDLDRSNIGDPIGTPGGLFFPTGERICHTIERPWNGGDNAQCVSAILPGTYELKLEPSNHFHRDLLHLQNVPARTHVMIHPANYPSQLEGCIAPGLIPIKYGVEMSHEAVAKIEKICADVFHGGGKVYLRVSNPQ